MRTTVALTYEGHVHHATASAWFTTLSLDTTLAFCRFTQLGLLRLLTAAAVMGDEVLTQPQAWAAHDRWLHDARVTLVDEPPEIETPFRVHAPSSASHKGLGGLLSRRIRDGRAADARHIRPQTRGQGQVRGPAVMSG